MRPKHDGLLTPRMFALLWLLLLTGCAPLRQVPPSPPAAPQPSSAACTGWTGATMAWPVLANLIAQQLEAQRLQACVPELQPAATTGK